MARPLGELQTLVVLAALRLGEEAYAVSIADEIEKQTGRSVDRASVYVTVRRLEDRGLVSTRFGDPLPERGGRARRYVTVEPAGIAAVGGARQSIDRLATGLDLDQVPG